MGAAVRHPGTAESFPLCSRPGEQAQTGNAESARGQAGFPEWPGGGRVSATGSPSACGTQAGMAWDSPGTHVQPRRIRRHRPQPSIKPGRDALVSGAWWGPRRRWAALCTGWTHPLERVESARLARRGPGVYALEDGRPALGRWLGGLVGGRLALGAVVQGRRRGGPGPPEAPGVVRQAGGQRVRWVGPAGGLEQLHAWRAGGLMCCGRACVCWRAQGGGPGACAGGTRSVERRAWSPHGQG